MSQFDKLIRLLIGFFERTYRFQTRFLIPIVFLIALSIRFNGNDLLIDGLTMPDIEKGSLSLDIEQYIDYVEFFRSDSKFHELQVDPPYSFRPLQPFLASLVPTHPLTALNLINIASLAIALFLLYKLIRKSGKDRGMAILAIYIIIFSFPFMYYGSVGYIDPMSLFFVTLGIYLYRKYGLWISIVLLPFALAQKEVTILYLFFIAGDWLSKLNKRHAILRSILMIGGGFLYYTFFKTFFEGGDYMWSPGTDFLRDNLTRARAYISPILSLGLPGLIILANMKIWSWKDDSAWLIALTAMLGLLGYAFVGAYVDGRFIFIGYSILSWYSIILIDRRYHEKPII